MTEHSNEPFELITALAYHPDAGFHLLALHLARLSTAHQAIATAIPLSWCARTPCPASAELNGALEEAVSGKQGLQRVSRSPTFPSRAVLG